MKRTLSNLSPALFLAVALLAASALVAAAPWAPWTAAAGPLLLGLALVGADVVYRPRSGGPLRPSSSSLLLAATLLVACGIVASSSRNPVALAGMFPILGGGVITPLILRLEGARTSCRRA